MNWYLDHSSGYHRVFKTTTAANSSFTWANYPSYSNAIHVFARVCVKRSASSECTVDPGNPPNEPFELESSYFSSPANTDATKFPSVQNASYNYSTGLAAYPANYVNSCVPATIVALPVQLTDFRVNATGGCVTELSWKSAVEELFQGFGVEYSLDAIHYQPIGAVAAKGNNSTYTFYHNAEGHTAFYRLRLNDKNGGFQYSQVIKADGGCEADGHPELYPNPAVSATTLRRLPRGAKMIRVYDGSGQIVYRQQTSDTQLTIQTDSWTNGTYLLEITLADGRHYTERLSRL